MARECLRLLSADPAFGRIVILTRRPLPDDLVGGLDRSKLEERVVDFGELSGHADLSRVGRKIPALADAYSQP